MSGYLPLRSTRVHLDQFHLLLTFQEMDFVYGVGDAIPFEVAVDNGNNRLIRYLYTDKFDKASNIYCTGTL